MSCLSRLAIQHEVMFALEGWQSHSPPSSHLNRLTEVGQRKVVSMHPSDSLSSPVEVSGFAFVVGIDIGSQSVV
jgi:hypothetical protein